MARPSAAAFPGEVAVLSDEVVPFPDEVATISEAARAIKENPAACRNLTAGDMEVAAARREDNWQPPED